MTGYIDFETLTWPEAAALPRATPLVIPLGGGYDLERLAETLDFPARAALLPPIPFGWRGSGLPVEEALFGRMAVNLVQSMRDDGFSRVYVLTPPGVDLGMGERQLVLPRLADPSQASAFPTAGDRGKVLLFPIGHTEQHGYHLPLNVDTLIIQAIGEQTAQRIPSAAFCLPAMPYGVSTHRAHFAGTLNAGGRAFEDFWLAVVEQLAGRGFDRFYLLSGHGGNCSFLVNVVKYAGERQPGIFCATAFLYLSGAEGAAALEAHRQSKIGGMGHACELETSLILHLRPDLVHMERAVDEVDFISTPSYYMDWVEGGALVANPPWSDDTATGAYGAGSLGSAEKGRIWLEAAIKEKMGHVAEIHEQQERRLEKRKKSLG